MKSEIKERERGDAKSPEHSEILAGKTVDRTCFAKDEPEVDIEE